jgi:hypothetical protein
MDVQMPRVNGIEAPNDIEGDCVAALRVKNAGFAKTLLSFWNEERNRCGVTHKDITEFLQVRRLRSSVELVAGTLKSFQKSKS